MSSILYDLEYVAQVLGVPNRRVREFVNEGRIASILVGRKKVKFTETAIDQFIADSETKSCLALTQARSLLSAAQDISSDGQKAVEAASEARALRIAEMLKKSSANSLSSETANQGQVIPIRS